MISRLGLTSHHGLSILWPADHSCSRGPYSRRPTYHTGCGSDLKDASSILTRISPNGSRASTFASELTTMSDSQLQTADHADKPAPSQVQDIMNPETFVSPDNLPIPRVTIEFCDRVRV
jgi:hypothetical protein